MAKLQTPVICECGFNTMDAKEANVHSLMSGCKVPLLKDLKEWKKSAFEYAQKVKEAKDTISRRNILIIDLRGQINYWKEEHESHHENDGEE